MLDNLYFEKSQSFVDTSLSTFYDLMQQSSLLCIVCVLVINIQMQLTQLKLVIEPGDRQGRVPRSPSTLETMSL
jgi:hypothetical protein